MIDTIVFDMGGVLIDFSAQLFTERLKVSGPDRALLERYVLRTADWVRLDRGTITEEEVLARACANLPRRLHAAADYIINHWNEPIVPIEGTAEVVRQLKARGYTLYLLSNAGVRQHGYWRDIPGKVDLTPSSCIFVDDLPLNVEAAQNAGMEGIVFFNACQLREELQKRGVL